MLRFALLGALSLALPAQTIVSGGGPALQLAVNAASPGDVLVVRPGGYDPLTVQIGVSILCDPGVVINATAGVVPIQITNVPAGQTATLRGSDTAFLNLSAMGLTVSDCAGTVVLEDVRTATVGATATNCTGPILVRRFTALRDRFQWTVSNCTNVGFVDSPALPPLNLASSNVYVAQCTSAPSNGQHNIPPIEMNASTVLVSDCRLTGNSSLAGIFLDHPAIVMASGDLTVAGSTRLTPPSFQTQLAPGVDIRAGRARFGPLVAISGTPPVRAPLSIPITFGEPLPSVTATGTSSGSALSATITGDPGSLTITLAGAPLPPTVLPFGVAFLSSVAPIFDMGFLPPQRRRTVSVVVPPLPAATPIVLQPVSLTVGGRIVIGTPTAIVLN